MTWFKVDDGLHSNRKVRHVRRTHPDKRRDIAPFGLWVLAGSWCGDNPDTRGFIPAEVVEEWDDYALDLAERLVAAGMWIEATQDGEKGYRFHDWDDYNPEDASSSGARGNHVRWHEKRGIVDPECEHCQRIIPSDSSGRIAPDHRGDIAPESGQDIGGESLTRPDPSRPTTARAARSRVRFEDFWALYPRKEGKRKAEAAWKQITKTTDPTLILDGLRNQLPSLAMKRRTDGDFRPHPTTWLNQGRWMDEVDGTGTRPADMPEGW